MAQRVIPFERAAIRGLDGPLRAASRRAILPSKGTMRLPGLGAPVHVRFDEHGVPHIRAETEADAFFAQGFCHARDRFFQMDILRRVLRGRLAETVGERALGGHGLPPFGAPNTTTDADRLMRVFDLAGASRRYLEIASDEDRTLLDAYVRGVNATVRLLRRQRPLEHRLMRLPLVPWSPVDSIVIAKGMALGLSFKWRTAPVFGAIAEHLVARPDLLGEILPRPPQAGEETVLRVVRSGIEDALRFLPGHTSAQGSNAFIVGGGRSKSGYPLLASDPHLELSLPSIWHLASVQGGRFGAVGCALPGLPGIVIGRTRGFAWGLTNGMIDDADFWREELEGSGNRYRLDGRWRPLRVETQEIRRRGKAPVLFRLRRTHRGPLMTDAFPSYAGDPLSLRMTLHDPASDLEAFLHLGRAEDGDAAARAAAGFGAPVQNLLWADTRGRAGYAMMGRVPIRPDTDAHVALPRDGTTSEHDWTGWVPQDELPSLHLGKDDVLVSANNPHMLADEYPHYLSHLYEPSYRARRIRERLDGRVGLEREDLVPIQMDATNIATRWFREAVLLPHAEAVRKTRPVLGRAVDLLLAWDGDEHPDAVGAALWHFTYNALLRRTFGQALGENLLPAWLGAVNLADAPLRRAFEDEDSPWAPPASRGALLQRALGDAIEALGARGLDLDARWGRVHHLTLKHPLGVVPVLGKVFNRGPIPLRGSPYSPVSGQYAHPKPARVTSGPSYRHVIDLADLERRASMVTLGGQSGHVGSKHYDDLTPLWLVGETIPMRLEREPQTREVLRLVP